MRRRPEADEAPPITLTPEQETLFATVADAPDQAVNAALREHGPLVRDLTREELRSLALIGGKEAVVSHVPDKGPLRQWVFFKALHRMLDGARDDKKQSAKLLALVRASAIVYWSRYAETIEMGVDDEDTLTAKLHRASNGFYGHAALKMAAAEPPNGVDGEGDPVVRQAAVWAGNTLRAALETITPRDIAILQKHYREDQPLTQIANDLGVPRSQYRTFVRHFDTLVATIGGRLVALGMNEMPPWLPDLSGTALGSEG